MILGLAVYFKPQLQLPGLLHWLQQLPRGGIALLAILWLGVDNWPGGWREHVTRTRVILLPKQLRSTQSPEQ